MRFSYRKRFSRDEFFSTPSHTIGQKNHEKHLNIRVENRAKNPMGAAYFYEDTFFGDDPLEMTLGQLNKKTTI